MRCELSWIERLATDQKARGSNPLQRAIPPQAIHCGGFFIICWRVGCAVSWWVYVLECRDGTLYTGCTDDIPRRLAAHNAGRGAKYTRGRGPVTLRYREETLDKPAALRREAAIKRLSRAGKQALIAVYNKENKDEI